MKQLIIARHGHDINGLLSDRGRIQVGLLAEKFNPLINGASVLILSSTADRAQKSAEILGAAFGVEFEKHEILWSGGSHFENLPAALELVKSYKDKADVLILVTHYEYTERFPGYFAEQEWKIRFQGQPLGNGEAWIIDCLERTLMRMV